ncbi:MAG: hypothetical protein J5449_05190 [Oscillospiraceae bacterium]|nr:hypothetical protein [Oscillospiraceae bacterium]
MAGINPVGYGGNVSAVWRQADYNAKVSAAYTAAANPSQPDSPVEPVSAVRRVAPDAAVRVPVAVQEPQIPTEAELNNASDNLARMRIQYPGEAESALGQTMAQAGINTFLMNAAGIS